MKFFVRKKRIFFLSIPYQLIHLLNAYKFIYFHVFEEYYNSSLKSNPFRRSNFSLLLIWYGNFMQTKKNWYPKNVDYFHFNNRFFFLGISIDIWMWWMWASQKKCLYLLPKQKHITVTATSVLPSFDFFFCFVFSIL